MKIFTKLSLFLLCCTLAVVMFAACNCKHEYSEWKTTKEPTCIAGEKTRACLNCKNEEIESIPRVEHKEGIKCETCGYKLISNISFSIINQQAYVEEQLVDGDVIIPATYTENGIVYDVVGIVDYAFSNSGISSITIPSSVTSIGDYAFKDCSNLISIAIPGSVISIGEGAFYNCISLTSITISDGLTSIGNIAFKDCISLTSITIPNSVTSIGVGAFKDCSSLTSITIPNNIVSIGEGVFNNCSSLTSITIPNSVTSIGENAFQYCSGLTSIAIPNGVTSIGENAFQYCNGLTIYAEAKDKPNGWNNNWNSSNRPVEWGNIVK